MKADVCGRPLEETMTPQERKLLDELFEKLASLEDAPRDEDAVAAINAGLERAPNALYPLVQTVLVQDEALKHADARIRALEAEIGIGAEQAAQPESFLDSMRDSLARRRESQGSVPTVRPPAAASGSSVWGAAYSQPRGNPGVQEPAAGGSFLGTAAAAAAGVIGGALLTNSFRGLFGGQHHQASASVGAGGKTESPWGPSASGSNLAREAGISDIGRDGRTGVHDTEGSERAGLFDVAQNDADEVNFDDDLDGDFDIDGDLT
jgi:hypothetical protein